MYLEGVTDQNKSGSYSFQITLLFLFLQHFDVQPFVTKLIEDDIFFFYNIFFFSLQSVLLNSIIIFLIFFFDFYKINLYHKSGIIIIIITVINFLLKKLLLHFTETNLFGQHQAHCSRSKTYKKNYKNTLKKT